MPPTFSDCSHGGAGASRASRVQIPPRTNVAPAPRRGRVVGRGDALPADALAQLDGLALLLAAVERSLDPRGHDHEHREEDHEAEREERDDAVVGLSDEPLAVVAGVGGGRWNEPGREHENWCQKPHSGVTIPCRSLWPSPSSASWRSRREAATSTSTTTSTT